MIGALQQYVKCGCDVCLLSRQTIETTERADDCVASSSRKRKENGGEFCVKVTVSNERVFHVFASTAQSLSPELLIGESHESRKIATVLRTPNGISPFARVRKRRIIAQPAILIVIADQSPGSTHEFDAEATEKIRGLKKMQDRRAGRRRPFFQSSSFLPSPKNDPNAVKRTANGRGEEKRESINNH